MRFLKSVVLSFIVSMILFAAVNPSQAATIIAPTSITANTTWTSDNVYVIQTNTTVQPGVTLTIQPSTVVKLKTTTSYLNIKGTLQASGTSDNNIIFTSYKDDTYGGDTNGDGSTTTPAVGNWKYIQSYSGGTVNCSYCRIRYGGYANNSMLYSSGGASNLDNCIVEKCSAKALEINGTASISNTQISDFATTGMVVNSGTPTLSGNTITGGNYGIYVVDGSPNINQNTLNNNTQKSIWLVNGSPIISGNILNGGDLTSNYGIVIENGSAQITNNSITHFPNYEAIQLGKLYGTTTTGVSANISGNTMSSCKYPLGFAGDKIPTISYESNDISGCSLLGIRVHMELTGQQTIPALSLPYVVTSFYVLTGATINIEPGAIFKTSGSTNLWIHGNLDAIGIDSNPIVFTSLKDDSFGGDTNNDGNTTLPQPGNWSYISMASTGEATFDHVTFQYGAQAIEASLDGYELTVKNCDISKMSYYGIHVRGANSALIESNAIHHNGKGIYCTSSASPDIKNNDIYNNTRGIDIPLMDLWRPGFMMMPED